MNIAELTWNRGRRFSDPHVITLGIDCLDWHRFRSFFEDHADVEILDAELDGDRITVQAGCRSAEIAGRLDDAWG